ncbi:MAG: alkaline phosphatase D family protein [Burkholderiales bacterium]|nr:alkaline phosphatase D family protein [Burkholderiales bacterium]
MRRQLVLFALLLGLSAVPARAERLTAGPMLGHLTARTADIWLQAEAAAEVEIEYWPSANPQQRRVSPRVRLEAASDHTARITLTDLAPGTHYGYRLRLDGQSPSVRGPYAFSTPPASPSAADFTLYLGSCAYVNDPPFDPPGPPRGGGYHIFQSIARHAAEAARPGLMLWLGDNVYLRAADYASPWGMNARYRHSRSLPELQPLLAAMPHYAVWDDHDYGPNDANRSFVFKDESLRLFQRYWANPSYGLRELPGIYTAFSFHDADFFLLDNRFYRSADKTQLAKEEIDLMREARDWALSQNPLTRLLGRRFLSSPQLALTEHKVMFGPEQLDWLKQALIQSRATFKFIVGGSQFLNDGHPFEGWHNFSAEREAFLAWLKRQNIPGVVFLSGDRHHTELLRREVRDFYPLYELTCSPLTARPHNPRGAEADNPLRVPGTLVTQRNFCSIEVTGSAEERMLVLRSHDADGRTLWERSLRASELRRSVLAD